MGRWIFTRSFKTYFAFGHEPTHLFLTENEWREGGNIAEQLRAMYHSNKTQQPVQTDLGEAGILPTSSYPRQAGFVLTTKKLQTLRK